MKKFKFKDKKKKKNILIILIILIITLFLILFSFLSMLTINRSYNSLLNIIFKEQKLITKKSSVFSNLTSNLSLLLRNDYTYSSNQKEIVYKEIKPLIYLYNTHDQEIYKGIAINDFNITDVNSIMKEQLSKYNIESYIEKERVSNYLEKNDLQYNNSYKVSRIFLENSALKYPSLKYFMDIHRDSVTKEYTMVTINNINYARIMFVLGLDNPNYAKNKELITKLNNYLETNYKGISRGIYEKSGEGVNGVYNQDFHPNTLLVEIGGVDNNLLEVINSTEILSKALYDVIGDKNEKTS